MIKKATHSGDASTVWNHAIQGINYVSLASNTRNGASSTVLKRGCASVSLRRSFFSQSLESDSVHCSLLGDSVWICPA